MVWWRWCGGAHKVAVAMRWCVYKHQAVERFGAENPKPSCCGSVSGAPCQTVVEGGIRQRWGGLYIAVAVGGGCIHKCEEGEGLGAKNPNPSTVAQIQVCYVKQRWRAVEKGGWVACMRQLWLQGLAFANLRRGLGVENPKLSYNAQFQVALGLHVSF